MAHAHMAHSRFSGPGAVEPKEAKFDFWSSMADLGALAMEVLELRRRSAAKTGSMVGDAGQSGLAREFAHGRSVLKAGRIVFNNDKKRGRLGIIRSVLHGLDYEGKDDKLIGEVDGKIVVAPQAFMKSHSEM